MGYLTKIGWGEDNDWCSFKEKERILLFFSIILVFRAIYLMVPTQNLAVIQKCLSKFSSDFENSSDFPPGSE